MYPTSTVKKPGAATVRSTAVHSASKLRDGCMCMVYSERCGSRNTVNIAALSPPRCNPEKYAEKGYTRKFKELIALPMCMPFGTSVGVFSPIRDFHPFQQGERACIRACFLTAYILEGRNKDKNGVQSSAVAFLTPPSP